MSYRIEYSPKKNRIYPPAVRKSYLRSPLAWMCGMVLFWGVFALNLAGIRSGWFAFMDGVTEKIRTGTGIGQAIAAQCASLWNDVHPG